MSPRTIYYRWEIKEIVSFFFFLFYTEERFYFIRSSLKLLQNFYLTHFPWRRREHRYKSKAATSSGNETQVKDTGIEIPAMQHFSKLIIDRNSVPVEMEIYYSQFLFSFFFFCYLNFFHTSRQTIWTRFCWKTKAEIATSSISTRGFVFGTRWFSHHDLISELSDGNWELAWKFYHTSKRKLVRFNWHSLKFVAYYDSNLKWS